MAREIFWKEQFRRIVTLFYPLSFDSFDQFSIQLDGIRSRLHTFHPTVFDFRVCSSLPMDILNPESSAIPVAFVDSRRKSCTRLGAASFHFLLRPLSSFQLLLSLRAAISASCRRLAAFPTIFFPIIPSSREKPEKTQSESNTLPSTSSHNSLESLKRDAKLCFLSIRISPRFHSKRFEIAQSLDGND